MRYNFHLISQRNITHNKNIISGPWKLGSHWSSLENGIENQSISQNVNVLFVKL